MLISLIWDVVFHIFNVLTLPITIPTIPDEVMGYIEQLFDYLEMGAGILANYTPFNYLMILFGVLLSVDIGIMVYHLVIWILKKIPVFGVS